MAASLPILTFHSLDDRPSVISFPPRLFERGMAGLYDSGCRTLTLPELSDCLRRGVRFPERSFAITFDDGYQSVYDQAFPILQRYSLSATVFLSVGHNGVKSDSERLPSLCERPMMSWREVKQMHRWGISFGAHTLTHHDPKGLPSSGAKHREHANTSGEKIPLIIEFLPGYSGIYSLHGVWEETGAGF